MKLSEIVAERKALLNAGELITQAMEAVAHFYPANDPAFWAMQDVRCELAARLSQLDYLERKAE